jgi:CHAD domain-containing protein
MLLERRARALQRHLPAALGGDHHGVHQARVATRRLREAVPVLSAGLAGDKQLRKARRKIRRLTRALGTVRELDVSLQILDELARRRDLPRSAVEDVRGHVVAERDRRHELMLGRLEKVDSGKLGRRLQAVAAHLEEGEQAAAWRPVLAARLVKRAKRLGSAVVEAGHIYGPERLHAVRIAAKKLRYTLELAAEGGVAAARPLVAALKRTQETLGRLHDLQILQHHVAEVQAQLPAGNGQGRGGHDAIAQVLESECRHLHARYLATVPSLTELVSACRASVIPQLARPAPRAARAVKMRLARGTRSQAIARS